MEEEEIIWGSPTAYNYFLPLAVWNIKANSRLSLSKTITPHGHFTSWLPLTKPLLLIIQHHGFPTNNCEVSHYCTQQRYTYTLAIHIRIVAISCKITDKMMIVPETAFYWRYFPRNSSSSPTKIVIPTEIWSLRTILYQWQCEGFYVLQ